MTTFVSLLVLLLCVVSHAAPAAAALVPSAGAVAGPIASAATRDKVNINSASVKELTTLEGVGPKLAERIVEYRDAHGPFRKAEDLRKVEGVGGVLWEKNRERIVIK
ncbi:MAG: ComEA family DNA-binding protein [Candidatus Rokuibacteriota bacterium]